MEGTPGEEPTIITGRMIIEPDDIGAAPVGMDAMLPKGPARQRDVLSVNRAAEEAAAARPTLMAQRFQAALTKRSTPEV